MIDKRLTTSNRVTLDNKEMLFAAVLFFILEELLQASDQLPLTGQLTKLQDADHIVQRRKSQTFLQMGNWGMCESHAHTS